MLQMNGKKLSIGIRNQNHLPSITKILNTKATTWKTKMKIKFDLYNFKDIILGDYYGKREYYRKVVHINEETPTFMLEAVS